MNIQLPAAWRLIEFWMPPRVCVCAIALLLVSGVSTATGQVNSSPDEVAVRLDKLALQISAKKDTKAADGVKKKAGEGSPCAMFLLSRIYMHGVSPNYPIPRDLSETDNTAIAFYLEQNQKLSIPADGPAAFWLRQAAISDFVPSLIPAGIVDLNRTDKELSPITEATPFYKAALFGVGQGLDGLAISISPERERQTSPIMPLENSPEFLRSLAGADVIRWVEYRGALRTLLQHLAVEAPIGPMPKTRYEFFIDDVESATTDNCDEEVVAANGWKSVGECREKTLWALHFYQAAYEHAKKTPPDFGCPSYQPRGLSVQDIIDLAKANTPEDTMISLVRLNGVDFALTSELERHLAADDGVTISELDAIRAAHQR